MSNILNASTKLKELLETSISFYISSFLSILIWFLTTLRKRNSWGGKLGSAFSSAWGVDSSSSCIATPELLLSFGPLSCLRSDPTGPQNSPFSSSSWALGFFFSEPIGPQNKGASSSSFLRCSSSYLIGPNVPMRSSCSFSSREFLLGRGEDERWVTLNACGACWWLGLPALLPLPAPIELDRGASWRETSSQNSE